MAEQVGNCQLCNNCKQIFIHPFQVFGFYWNIRNAIPHHYWADFSLHIIIWLFLYHHAFPFMLSFLPADIDFSHVKLSPFLSWFLFTWLIWSILLILLFSLQNGMHSLCPAIWSKHRRWLLMSMVCLNPLACVSQISDMDSEI